LVALERRTGFEVRGKFKLRVSLGWMSSVFDEKFDFESLKGNSWSRVKTWRQFILLVVGFEIEASTKTKTLKGSMVNLNN